jgi:hypothetical protein
MNAFWEWLLGFSGGRFEGAAGWSVRMAGMPASAAAMLGLLALLGLLGWVVLRCYAREVAAAPPVRMGIAALRLAVLALGLAVLLQPELVVQFVRVESDAVAVLVDDTLSMRWRDSYADDADRSALAAALGIGQERLAGADRLTRTEAAEGALTRRGGALERFAADHPVLVYSFGAADGNSYVQPIRWAATGAGAEATPPGDPSAPGRSPPDPTIDPGAARNAKGLALEAAGRHTDLGRAVREALDLLEGRRLAAIVVVSDGRSTGLGRAPLAGAVQVARQRGVPLYAVAVGDPTPPQNVAVTQLLAPREARAGTKIQFTALVAHRAMPGTTLEVRLWRGRPGQDAWEDTGARADVAVGRDPTAPGTDHHAALEEATLTTEAPAVGTYVYKARIQAPRQDSIPGDNEATAVLRVTDQKMKVLLVGGSSSWEFQYLRNFLLRSEDHYAVTAWQQNADPAFNQDASTGMKRAHLPTTRQELIAYDVVVLCDPRHVPGSFDERFVELLEEFVSKHQGGLCYVSGDKFTGRTLTRHGALEPLAALLPVVLASETGVALPGAEQRQGFLLDLTAEGRIHPAMQVAAEGRDNLETWRRLPAVYRCHPPGRLKPLATALAVRADGDGTGDQAEPLIAVQHYGRGRVLLIGFEGTWRWRALDEAACAERFWSNMMEFLGAGRLEKNRLLVTTAGDTFDAGSDIEVRVEAYNRDLNPLDVAGLVLEMRPLEAAAAPLRQTIRRDRLGLYVGALRAERVGTFELDVVSDDKGGTDWTPEDVSTRRIQVQLPQAEFLRPEADHDAMRELAGDERRFVPLHRIGDLPGRIPPGRISITTESPHPLWSTKVMLILFGALLLAEWTLRKVFKMM